jgi:hypothetical protein
LVELHQLLTIHRTREATTVFQAGCYDSDAVL